MENEEEAQPIEEQPQVEETQETQEPEQDDQLNTGWFCITKDNKFMAEWQGITEDNPFGGRPIDMGQNNELILVGVSGNGHRAAVDLRNGAIFLDFDRVAMQNGTIELGNLKTYFYICEETNILGNMAHKKITKPDKRGDYLITYDPIIFRPIWFTRHISTLPGPVYVVGAQAITPKEMGKRNVKKIVSFFPDGSIGIS